MPDYQLKPGKIGKAVVDAYEKVENKFTETFLERDENSETGYTLKTGKIAETVTKAYQAIEDGVTGTYKKIEDSVTGTYQKIEDAFVEKFLDKKD